MNNTAAHERAQAKAAWERMVRYVERVPTLPQCVFAVQREVSSPAASAVTVGRIIAQDQALTTRVLRLVNSAYYGVSQQVKDVQQAVALLGFERIRSLLYTLSVADMFAARQPPGGLQRADLWRHAVTTAAAARELASLAQGADPDAAFTAGILHDIGKAVLDQYAHAEFEGAVQMALQDRIPLVEAEIREMGISHAQVGRLLLRHWQLPEDLVAATARHHSPSSLSEHYPLTWCVHVANWAATEAGHGTMPDLPSSRLEAHVEKSLRRTADWRLKLCELVARELAKYGEMLEILTT